MPAGAVPKDGPSAGITMATAIVSLISGRPVSEHVGMTGEITLTGQVLQIGGVRDKVLAAQRAGLRTVVLPRENEPDLEELPAEARGGTRLRARVLDRRGARDGARRPGGEAGARVGSLFAYPGRREPPPDNDERTTMASTKDRISEARPYVERAVKDEEVRENVLAAFQVAREIYNELIGNRGVTTIAARVATDKDIQEKLREALDDLREAADHVQGKKDHSGRNTMLLITGITLGILFNPMTGPGRPASG